MCTPAIPLWKRAYDGWQECYCDFCCLLCLGTEQGCGLQDVGTSTGGSEGSSKECGRSLIRVRQQAMFSTLLHHLVHALAVLALFSVLCTGGRELSDVGPGNESGTEIYSPLMNESTRLSGGFEKALDTIPLEGKGVPERSVVAIGLASINRDWRPYVVLGVGEFFGYIVRSITGTNTCQSLLTRLQVTHHSTWGPLHLTHTCIGICMSCEDANR